MTIQNLFLSAVLSCALGEVASASLQGPALPHPQSPTSAVEPEVATALDAVFGSGFQPGDWNSERRDALATVADSGDARLAWIVTDLLRLSASRDGRALLIGAGEELLGLDTSGKEPFTVMIDHLIANDVPAPPGYLDFKRTIFRPWGEEWMRLMVPGDVDWRLVTWGGVKIDERPFGKTDEPCNCIPAADNPEVSSATEATWLKDSDVVFGISIGDEHRAYPRRIMEVREMVNDTLGGRDLGIPYCTLCAAAQAYFTDRMPKGIERPVLRTSGLLSRSNKLMYDVVTDSVFDTFLGVAQTGPLAKAGVVLEQAPVITTTWGEWRKAHPTTTVLVEALALGRNFDFRGGRDAKGPIFPTGPVDPRLPVQADIVGVISPSGKAVAFDVDASLKALRAGTTVSLEGVELRLAAGGLAAFDPKGEPLSSHQAFWFAWSQFRPGTLLWKAATKD